MDAPYHFYTDGKTINEIDLEHFVGVCYVAEHEGIVTADDAIAMIEEPEEQTENP